MASLWRLESLKLRSVTANTTPAAPMANPAVIVFAARGVNLNATGDTAAPIALPSGVTRYRVDAVAVSNSGGALPSTARLGVYTAASQGGVAICAQQALSAITSQSTDANDNMMQLTDHECDDGELRRRRRSTSTSAPPRARRRPPMSRSP